MLSHEWRELEVLCERIGDLRHRFTAAQRTKNVGLIEGLKNDLTRARRQRELLVHHISACLSSATTIRRPASIDADDARPHPPEPVASEAHAVVTIGFDQA